MYHTYWKFFDCDRDMLQGQLVVVWCGVVESGDCVAETLGHLSAITRAICFHLEHINNQTAMEIKRNRRVEYNALRIRNILNDFILLLSLNRCLWSNANRFLTLISIMKTFTYRNVKLLLFFSAFRSIEFDSIRCAFEYCFVNKMWKAPWNVNVLPNRGY